MIILALGKNSWGAGLRSRLTSSRPDAILITRTPFSPFTSCSHHHALRSRHKPTPRTTTANCVRQPHQLNANQRHVHFIEIKYCEDTRPGQRLEEAQQQHANLGKLFNAKAVTLHTILLSLGPDHQRAIKLARKLHAHSVLYANKLVTTRHAIESINTSYSQVMGPGALSNPSDPRENFLFCSLKAEEAHGSSEPM
eukprot:1139538-Pelagomonas_calceolata.AAC.5